MSWPCIDNEVTLHNKFHCRWVPFWHLFIYAYYLLIFCLFSVVYLFIYLFFFSFKCLGVSFLLLKTGLWFVFGLSAVKKSFRAYYKWCSPRPVCPDMPQVNTFSVSPRSGYSLFTYVLRSFFSATGPVIFFTGFLPCLKYQHTLNSHYLKLRGTRTVAWNKMYSKLSQCCP